MFRRQAILEIFPKTRVSRWHQGEAFLIALIPILLLFLASCQQKQHSVTVKFYSTLTECINDRVLSQRCQDAYTQAQQKHLQEGPFFEQKTECEQETLEPCQAISINQILMYKPIMQGFVVSVPNTSPYQSTGGGGGGGSGGYPVYGRSSNYRLGNGEPLRLSPNRTATVTSKGITRGFGSSFKSSGSRS